ncbi:MAG: D-alanyl-D-alanine carboxypeptidase/D-alanyl-D-alanine-endopeptidase, partial [Sphingomonas sp.]
NPDQRFVPASNTKMFTTATAFWSLPGLDQPDSAGGTRIRLEGGRVPDVVLEGRGDARLSSAADCTVDCLATLAGAVAAKAKRVHDVIGDDSWFPDERWGPGMSWNNIETKYGTGISALTLDDNEYPGTIAPGAVGGPPRLTAPGFYTIENGATTVASGGRGLRYNRAPNGDTLRVNGTIDAVAKPTEWRLGIDDPARWAAFSLRKLLEARGVTVTGTIGVRHRPLTSADDPAVRKGTPAAHPPEAAALASLTPPPLAEDLRIINKVSQNLHAELMLRRISRVSGSGSIADGQARVQAMLATAGVPRTAFDFADGSGMSNYNRINPRGTVTMLRWIAAQPWGAAWRETLPVGGVDGSLKRLAGTPLDHKLFAKTGTLNASSALSGYIIAKSGRTLTFSLLANDMPEDRSVAKQMDAALQLIAAAN